MKDVIVAIGSGAIARRVSVGKHILLADIKTENGRHAENNPSRKHDDSRRINSISAGIYSFRNMMLAVWSSCRFTSHSEFQRWL
ncbi:hypothetical protein PT300_10420 [Enterobacteriaceae bacterium ESL0689]|nr:hypothetical protein [Enterobacteriaceae bacterium ESL0689]